MQQHCENSPNSHGKDVSRESPKKQASKKIYKSEVDDRLCKELSSRLIKKSESIQKVRKYILELARSKNALLSKLRWKDKEIFALHGKVTLLLRELSATKADHLKALEEIKILKLKNDKVFQKNEIIEQKKSLYDEMQKENMESQKLLTKEKLKAKKLEALKLNPNRWRTMQYTDPDYFETLQKKNHMQKALTKKINSMQGKDALLEEKDQLIKNLQNKLEGRPYNIMKDPTQQMMEFYKTIELQNEKIKCLTYQVNMFESLLADKFHQLPSQKYAI